MNELLTPRQLEYLDWEFGIFVHFGIRTFYPAHQDWDGQERLMQPQKFAPQDLRCEQWAAAAVAAGARYLVFTAKHHDGFANWPSQYTDFSVASSPWREGRGDVVRDYVDACRKFGLRVGLYYSPADAGAPCYANPAEYDDYFIRQVTELLDGRYGPIDYLWFDGCGSENHQYDWPRIVAAIRALQPQILLFSLGDPDVRWVGNESGLADLPHYYRVDDVWLSVRTEKKILFPGAKTVLPAECDLMMRDTRWFWSPHDETTVKSPAELMGIYDYSVGRGCNMLLNVGPDQRGLFPERDCQSLQEFGAMVRRRFATPVVTTADFREENHSWCAQTEISVHNHVCAGGWRIDHAVLMEDLRAGQQIERFRIKVLPYYNAHAEITVFEGTTVGHKAICMFPAVRCRAVRVEIINPPTSCRFRDITFYSAGTQW